MPLPPDPRTVPTDHDPLLARLQAGDRAAFEQLVRELSPRMLAVARRLLRNEEDAADAVQDAFISAFKALPGFDGRARLSTWLHRIVVNAALMRLRKSARRGERQIGDYLPLFADDGHAAVPASPWKRGDGTDGSAPGSRLLSAETRALVRAGIDQLPEAYRTILVLRDIEGLDTEQAAELLEETPSAVKTRLHRARQALRTILDPAMQRGSL